MAKRIKKAPPKMPAPTTKGKKARSEEFANIVVWLGLVVTAFSLASGVANVIHTQPDPYAGGEQITDFIRSWIIPIIQSNLSGFIYAFVSLGAVIVLMRAIAVIDRSHFFVESDREISEAQGQTKADKALIWLIGFGVIPAIFRVFGFDAIYIGLSVIVFMVALCVFLILLAIHESNYINRLVHIGFRKVVIIPGAILFGIVSLIATWDKAAIQARDQNLNKHISFCKDFDAKDYSGKNKEILSAVRDKCDKIMEQRLADFIVSAALTESTDPSSHK